MPEGPSQRVFVIHWDVDGAESLAESLADRGLHVEAVAAEAAVACELVSNCVPFAAIAALDEHPGEVCGLACELAAAGAGLATPIIFVGGLPEDREAALARAPGSVAVDRTELPWLVKRLAVDQ